MFSSFGSGTKEELSNEVHLLRSSHACVQQNKPKQEKKTFIFTGTQHTTHSTFVHVSEWNVLRAVSVQKTDLRLGDVDDFVTELKEECVLGGAGALQAAETLRAEREAASVCTQPKQNTPYDPRVAFLKAHPQVDVT